MKLNKTKAFTLAEVLITLGIIGIVAAMTMPTLIAKHKTKETVSKLKKAYSTLSQAYLFAKNEHGTPDYWIEGEPSTWESSSSLVSKLKPYLNIVKDCGNQPGCFWNGKYRLLNGNDWHNIDETSAKGSKYRFMLNDGSSYAIEVYSTSCDKNYGSYPLNETCAQLQVDINGFKAPNTAGKDLFWFYLTKQGFVAAGIVGDENAPFTKCSTSTSGAGCTAWVIFNENQDYLGCSDLSWDGKHACK